jgi:hypothetical protein
MTIARGKPSFKVVKFQWNFGRSSGAATLVSRDLRPAKPCSTFATGFGYA